MAGADKYGVQPPSSWSVGGNYNAGLLYSNPTNQLLSVPKGWRNGDWLCNYGDWLCNGAQCKKCNAFPPALGTKRLASEELVHDWDNKRLNVGSTVGHQQSYPGFEQVVGTSGNHVTGPYASYPPSVSSGMAPNLQVPMPLTQQTTTPTLLGKGSSKPSQLKKIIKTMAGSGSPCRACKFLRRKCVRGCILAPYFCHEEGATDFSTIHKVFGASNVSKHLAHLPLSDRCDAAVRISWEAQARLQDPIYGYVSHIFALEQQVVNLQAQLAFLKDQAAQSFVMALL